MPDSFVEGLRERAAIVRQHSKRFSIASMGSMRWSYKSDRSEGAASIASTVSSAPSSTTLSDTSSMRGHSHSVPPGHPARRHGKAPMTKFEPVYVRKLREDNERRAASKSLRSRDVTNETVGMAEVRTQIAEE